jgi:hypothetical protein
MRRLLLAAVVLTAHAAPLAQPIQDRPLQADGVVRLLANLENALASGRIESLRALASPALPEAHHQPFLRATRGGLPSIAIVRESSRRPFEFAPGYEVVADILVSHGRQGRITTWQLTVAPQGGTRDRFQLTAIVEIAAVDGLLKLALDTTRQFAVHQLAIRAPDLTLTLESGSAFVAETEAGVTALVFRGKGHVHFAPADAAERGQLQLFAKRPAFTSRIDTAFVRLNPGEFAGRVPEAGLTPVAVNPEELRRAQQVFDTLSPRTYTLDLRILTPERWSLEPGAGSSVIEFRTASHGWLTYARSPGEQEDVSFFDRARGRNISVYASPETLLRRGPVYSDEDDATYDVQHYGLDLAFDPERLWVSGRGSLRIRIKRMSVGSITIKLAPALVVSSVSSPGFGRLLALRVVGQSSVLVSLPRAVDRGEELTIDIAYAGRLDSQALDREAIAPDGQVQNPPDPRQPGETPLVTPEPRFMYSNRVAWYPQAPISDYAGATLRLSVPSEYQIVATGSLRGSTVAQAEPAGRDPARFARTVEYVADRPVRYLACIISRFVPLGRTRVDVGASAINLEIVSTPRTAGRNRQMAARVAGMLRFYAATAGDAPYPDFTVAALDDNLPGGHSPPYFAIFHQALPTTPFSWTDDPVSFDTAYPHFFLAHEVAHQWWGQAIGWKNYHEQWLSEGFSQYFAALYAGHDRGPAMLRSLIADMRRTAMPLLSQGPIALGYRLGHIQAQGRVFRAIVYNKSAVVLHMLRQLIGDDAFFAGVRKFYKDWRFQMAGTDDLREAFEAGTPMKLGRFFDRWIRGATVPRIRFTSRVADDRTSATVRVEQIGDVFDLPLIVAVQYADGTTEERLVKVTDSAVEERIPLKGAIRRISPREELALVEIVR